MNTATNLKKSKQRDAILACVMRHHDHPTADVIYQEIREEFPHVSLGTVYRNLSLLNDIGMIRKISCDDAGDHFDGNIHPHSHFCCKNCGKLEDIPEMMEPNVSLDSLSGFKGEIEDYSVIFYGKCESCS